MPSKYPPIAVIGVSAMFPGSTDSQGFWRDILAGRDLLTEVPETHWLIEDYYDSDPAAPDKMYCRRGGFLQETGFAPMEFGVPPSSLPSTDTSQLLALIVAKRVLEDATRGDLTRLQRERVSVVLGVASTTELTAHMAGRLQRPLWVKAMRAGGLPEAKVEEIDKRLAGFYVPWQESTFPGLLANVVSGRIANQMDLGGTNCVIDAACASSLAALSVGLNELYLHQADLVIAGGVDTLNDILMFMCFAKTTALSPTEDCRPFSDRADGTMLGEGLGMFALKRLEDAERDGDHIYALIRGLGSSSDGYAKSIYAPRAEGQASALRRAYEGAGYTPQTVELVEAHGTATKAGDAAEFGGLRMVFDSASSPRRQWCALGSVKSQIGHTKAAAGAASLFKAIMALHHKVLPPTIKVDAPNPDLHLEESPFYLNTRARPWIRSSDHPRRASVSSFGFGGTNFHVTLEEYTGVQNPSTIRTLPSELVLFSAPSPEALVARCRTHLSESFELAHLARASQMSFDSSQRARLALVATDADAVRRKIEQAIANISQQPDRGFSSPDGLFYGCGEEPGNVAFLFPGQGSQYVEMGADVAMHFEVVRSLWDRVASLPLNSDDKLHEFVFPPPVFTEVERRTQSDRLTRTERAQPAIGVVSAGLLAILRDLGISAACVGGHSFGEITALYAAGALDEASFLRVARTRGELMALAPKVAGAMTAVLAPREALRTVMEGWDLDVVMANCNSPAQTVLSGPTGAIEAAEQRLKESGMVARRLNVSTAFHSHLVHDASCTFQEFLNEIEFSAPSVTVFANADAQPYPGRPEQIRNRLAAQMESPVLFEQQINAMYEQGVRTFLEVGPGSALSGLVEECLHGKEHLAVPLDRRGKHGVTALFEALGRLAVRGVPMAFDALWGNEAFETTPQERQRPAASFVIPIGGANHGKPYPAAARAEIPVPAPVPVPAPPPATAAVAPTSQENLAWLDAYERVQQQTVEAQTTFQRLMTESHVAFLKTAEHSLQQLTQQLQGHAALPQINAPAPLPYVSAPISLPMPEPVRPMTAAAPVEIVQAAAPLPPAAPAKPAPDIDMERLLLEVVSEKTGYPVEMLDMSMVMESDLGIDSIKRVQILSAVQDRVPDLPEVETNQLAGLRTLGEILAYMRSSGLGGALPQKSGVSDPQPPASRAAVPLRKGDTNTLPSLPLTKGESREAAGGRSSRIFESKPLGGEPPTSDITNSMQRYVVRPVSAHPTAFGMPGLRSGTVLVTDDETGIAAALAAELSSRGLQTAVVQTVPSDAEAVIFLGGLKPVADFEAAVAVNKEAFHIAKTIAPRFHQSGGVFVTVQDTAGAARAWLAGVGALTKTADLEWPNATVKVIDIERNGRSAEAVAEAIAEELFAGGPDIEVRLLADATRWVPRCVSENIAAQAPCIDEKAVILASGGARGVTAAALLELAKQTRARFVLLGRTSLISEPACCEGIEDASELKRVVLSEARKRGEKLAPRELDREANLLMANREIRATLESFAEMGAPAQYVSLDVRDSAALSAALEPIRQVWGPITGLVHGAGVLADALIEHKTPAQFAEVFSTKVDGLQALLQATAHDPLRMICLFSSVAARYGNPGQSDYAMANEILNKVAQDEAKRRGPGVKVKSINWGPWEAGMVTPELQQHFADRGVALIPLAAGARSFVEEIQGKPSGDVEVVIGSGMMPGAETRETTVEVVVNAATHPHLASHCIQGVPTLPVVQVIEWFIRLAQACAPDLTVKACRRVKVLKGVLLKGFNNNADERFILRCYRIANGSGMTLRLELKGPDDTRYYETDVEMIAAGEPQADHRFERSDLQLESSPWTTSQLYNRERLFHGRDFQVIQTMLGISRSGIAAILSGTGAMGWLGGPWRTDAAAMDGGLQLMLLWSSQYMEQQCLPLGIGEFTQYAEPPDGIPLHCVVRTNQSSSLHASFDMLLMLPDEQPVARFSDVQMYVVPGGTS